MNIRRIGIIGGGTAGYLTALGLKKTFPEFTVELIESSEIPVIGVGEASTPYLGHYLHNSLELDLQEFYRSVRPTWKLGIRFDWGAGPAHVFNYPFGKTELGKANKFSGDINRSSITSMLMTHKRSPVFRKGKNGRTTIDSRLQDYKFAYHIDNKSFVSYLQKKADDFGVQRLDKKITRVIPNDKSGTISMVMSESGEKFRYDLYFDCTGFRSLLMGEALQSDFISYGKSLFADTAVISTCPHDGPMRPYTYSRTMNYGWCWDIPTQDERHLGYVFSSRYCSVEEAVNELMARFKIINTPTTLRFKSGRRTHFWKGNTIAIGNAHAFVEPLESTGLHMIVQSILAVIESIDGEGGIKVDSETVNDQINSHWDYLRWFLAMHYKFQGRLNTPFWAACRDETDISGIQDLVDIYTNRGLLTELGKNEQFVLMEFIKDPLFSLRGIDQVLLGMGISPGIGISYSENDYKKWETHERLLEKELVNAIPQREALEILNADPSLLGHAKDLSDL